MGERFIIDRVVLNGGIELRHNEPLEVDFQFRCLSDVTAVSLGIGFCNREGSRVLSLDSDIPGERWNFSAGTQGHAVLRVENLLLEPDTYTIDVGARSGDNFGLEYVAQAGVATVIPGATTPPVIAMRESGHGGVRQPATWRLSATP
jgi:hypothetical protein